LLALFAALVRFVEKCAFAPLRSAPLHSALVLGVLRFKFEWVVLDCVGAALSVGNLIGYSRCDKEKKRRWKEFGRQVGVGGEGDGGWNMSSVGGNVFGEGARNAFANAMFVNSVASTLNGNGNGDGDDRL